VNLQDEPARGEEIKKELIKIVTVSLVEKYNPEWPKWFEEIKAYLGVKIAKACIRIEHVGSTAIPGMIAKPIIDIIIVIEAERWEKMKSLLEERGYYHRGNQGIEDREVFRLIDETPLPLHHLYVCPKHSYEIKKETAFRDYMKTHKKDRERLSKHKRELAEKFNNDRQLYIDGKDAMVKEITEKALKYSKARKS
jgi:GrpB-like predicted nucleotidyltransferase (UPF0157 family)